MVGVGEELVVGEDVVTVLLEKLELVVVQGA